jgi:RecB family endonuclease NucS
MTLATTKQQLHDYIDAMPEQSLLMVKEIIEKAYWKPVIETDLTEEELEIIRVEMEERERNPNSCKKWRDVRKG